MHLLFTNNTLDALAGSELYVYEMALEMHRRGHQITCFSLQPGQISDKLAAKGLTIATSIDELLALPPVDLIHAHHRLEARLAAACFPLTPIIFASLGPFHPLEQPGEGHHLFTRFLAISQDIKDNLVRYQHIPAEKVTVVPNFVDLARFTATRQIPEKPRRALVLTNYFKTEGLLPDACWLAGELELKAVGGPTGNGAVWNVEEYLDWADVVITSARGALQAMAMGRAAVIYRPSGSDGLLTLANFEASLYHNFSGRAFGKMFDATTLAAEITGYQLNDVEQLQARIRTEFSLERAADCLLALYHQTIDEYRQQWPAAAEPARYQLVASELARFLTGFKHRDNFKAHYAYTLTDTSQIGPELAPKLQEILNFLADTHAEILVHSEHRQGLETHLNYVATDLREQTANVARQQSRLTELENQLAEASAKINLLEQQNRELMAENDWQKQNLANTQAELQALLQTKTVKLVQKLGKLRPK